MGNTRKTALRKQEVYLCPINNSSFTYNYFNMKNLLMTLLFFAGLSVMQAQAQSCSKPCPPEACKTSCVDKKCVDTKCTMGAAKSQGNKQCTPEQMKSCPAGGPGSGCCAANKSVGAVAPATTVKQTSVSAAAPTEKLTSGNKE